MSNTKIIICLCKKKIKKINNNHYHCIIIISIKYTTYSLRIESKIKVIVILFNFSFRSISFFHEINFILLVKKRRNDRQYLSIFEEEVAVGENIDNPKDKIISLLI